MSTREIKIHQGLYVIHFILEYKHSLVIPKWNEESYAGNRDYFIQGDFS